MTQTVPAKPRASRTASQQQLGARLVLVHGTPIAPSVMYGPLFDSKALQREALDDAQRLLEEVARTCKATEVSSRAEQGPDGPGARRLSES